MIHSSPSGLRRVEEARKREDHFLADQVRKNEEEQRANIRNVSTDANAQDPTAYDVTR